MPTPLSYSVWRYIQLDAGVGVSRDRRRLGRSRHAAARDTQPRQNNPEDMPWPTRAENHPLASPPRSTKCKGLHSECVWIAFPSRKF
jgi:hypothetical protein